MSNGKAVKHDFAELPGARLYYEISGEGTRLLIIFCVEELHHRRSA